MLYFCSEGRRFRYLTEENLRDHHRLAEVELFISDLEAKYDALNKEKQLPENVEVALEISDEGWNYYMIDVERQCLFWVDDHDLTWMANMIGGIESESQLRMSISVY